MVSQPPRPPPPPPPRQLPRPQTTAQQGSNVSSRPPPPPPPPPPPLQKQTDQPKQPQPQPQQPPTLIINNEMPSAPTPSKVSSSYTSYASASKNYEPYGEVQVNANSYGISHRRHHDNNNNYNMNNSTSAASPYMYGGTATTPASSYASPPQPPVLSKDSQRSSGSISLGSDYYQYNTSVLCFMVPTLASILWWHEYTVVIEVFIMYALVLYALDLLNTRDATAVIIWFGALVLTMVSGFGALLQVDDDDASGGVMILYLVRLGVEGMFYLAVACWFTLQFKWLYKEAPLMAIGMERSLHSVLPPVTASILCFHVVQIYTEYWGRDRVALLAPHVFALLMCTGMFVLTCCPASFNTPVTEDNPPREKSISSIQPDEYTVPSLVARIHSMVLMLTPGMMHLLLFRRRILSRYASFDDLFDLVLVWAVPYLLQYMLLTFPENSPYDNLSAALFPKDQSTLRGSLVPMSISLAAAIAFQQRYLIPLCHEVSYLFNGHDLPSTTVVTLYLTVSTCSAFFALWIWGRKSSITDELFFGEYHEDVVQLSISASGMLLGKSFGMPWSLTPLPVLAFLGLSVWVTTRMLRYLAIFLFVVHSTGLVLFSYRFAGIDMKIAMAIPGIELGLVRFGMVCVVASVLVGLVAGMAVRPAGGIGASLLKRIDVAGVLFVLYSIVLMGLEATLLKRQLPGQELTGRDHDSGQIDEEYVYDHATALMTCILQLGVTVISERYRVFSPKSSVVALSCVIGKAIAILIDANRYQSRTRNEEQQHYKAEKVFFSAISASILLLVMLAPRTFLNPVHVKGSARFKRTVSSGKSNTVIPAEVYRTVYIYAFGLLPTAILAAIPYVFKPLASVMSAHFQGGAYYTVSPPISELLGVALALWGASCLFMLNHFMPDGGGETLKKVAALIFLMGLGVVASAPTMPEWISAGDINGIANPFASVSSVGSRLMHRGRKRTGGWGLLAASLATLLAVTGPLELRERRHPSGRKDQSFLLRLMIFSILFGSGVSWFITIQSMSQQDFLVLVVTTVGCMIVSFFGTVSSVLAYFLELENFEEVQQVVGVSAIASIIFAIITGAPHVFAGAVSSINAFAPGGWLATYLTVCCCVTLALSCALRARQNKNQATRALGNASCIVCWVLSMILLYGRYGVAGLDASFDVTTIFGFPVSVLGTFILAPILLALEGEVAAERRGRVQRVSSTTKPPKQVLGLVLKTLGSSNRFFPPLAAIASVFILVTLYAIFLRGSFILGGGNIEKNIASFSASSFVGNNAGDSLEAMARKSVSNSQALSIAAKLARSGFWTTNNFTGPLIHLAGLVATIPSLLLITVQQWSGSTVSKSQVTFSFPLNLFPLILCKGIPSLRALALVCFVGGLVQVMNLQHKTQKSNMRI